jgi:hypothetical protein
LKSELYTDLNPVFNHVMVLRLQNVADIFKETNQDVCVKSNFLPNWAILERNPDFYKYIDTTSLEMWIYYAEQLIKNDLHQSYPWLHLCYHLEKFSIFVLQFCICSKRVRTGVVQVGKGRLLTLTSKCALESESPVKRTVPWKLTGGNLLSLGSECKIEFGPDQRCRLSSSLGSWRLRKTALVGNIKILFEETGIQAASAVKRIRLAILRIRKKPEGQCLLRLINSIEVTDRPSDGWVRGLVRIPKTQLKSGTLGKLLRLEFLNRVWFSDAFQGIQRLPEMYHRLAQEIKYNSPIDEIAASVHAIPCAVQTHSNYDDSQAQLEYNSGNFWSPLRSLGKEMRQNELGQAYWRHLAFCLRHLKRKDLFEAIVFDGQIGEPIIREIKKDERLAKYLMCD